LSSPCPHFVSFKIWKPLTPKTNFHPQDFSAVIMLKKKNSMLLLIILAALLLIVSVIVVFNKRIHSIETKQQVR